MQELYIDSDDELQTFVAAIEDIATVALDTEFVREKTYFPQLCLVQIATGDAIACIDCLAPIDLGRLYDVLLRPDCAWIVHSSRQDLEVIHQHARRLPQRLIDTQIAAGLVGYAPQIGLQDILSTMLGVELAKDYTRTDWSRRPLPPAAVAYARDDVRSLHALWSALEERLVELGRRDWLDQDCKLLTSLPPTTPTEQIWSRLRGLRRLSVECRAAAFGLVAWRERRAQDRDRPRRWILADDELIAIAAQRPAHIDALRTVPNLPSRLIDRCGAEILEALAATDDPALRARAERIDDQEPPDKQQMRTSQAKVKRLAAELDIFPEVLATKQDLAELLAGRSPVRITTTWRRAVLGELSSGDS